MTRVLVALLSCSLLGCSDNAKPDTPDLAVATAEDMSAAADLTVGDQAEPDLEPAPCASADGVPPTLACSGLYTDFPTRTLAPGVQPYAPGYALWSDGAIKQRWVYLPAGQTIDVSQAGDWVFPTGTRLWKEFSIEVAGASKRIETRLYWKRNPGDWVGAVYRWSDDETAAPRLENGEAAVDGTTYEVPAENRCIACHKGRTDAALGFEAVLLAAPSATGLTYQVLQASGLLSSTNANDTIPASSLQIPGTDTERAALGYLHTNCGMVCHNTSPPPGDIRLDIDVSSGSAPSTVAATLAYGAINRASITTLVPPPDLMSTYYQIRPADPSRSMVRVRMAIRDAAFGSSGMDQMPPLVTHTVDADGLATVDAWIDAMTPANGYPAPSP